VPLAETLPYRVDIEAVTALGVVVGLGQYASERCVTLLKFGDIFRRSDHDAAGTNSQHGLEVYR
jgi:hypothetical protein